MKIKLFRQLKQSGQAALEYLLLLFVIISILLGVVLTFADGTRRFVDNYFGAYFKCLLEAGELPTLGGDAGGANASECESEFQPFTLAEGRPPVFTDLDVVGGASTTDNLVNVDDLDGSSGSESVTGGSVIPVGSGDRFGDSSFGRSTVVPIVSAGRRGSSADGAQSPSISMNNVQSGDFDESLGRQAYVPILSGRVGVTEEREGASIVVTQAKSSGDGEDLRSIKRVPAKVTEKKESVEEPDVSLGIPDFLRYILIIGMIVAIVVFFGGQVLQYQKSKDLL
jgi:hypothetical protein